MTSVADMWKDLDNALASAKAQDFSADEKLFAAVYGWSHPLHGAALQEFERIGREEGLTDFTGDTEAAFALAERFSDAVSFKIEREANKRAGVRMTLKVYNAVQKAEVETEVWAGAASVALAICRCVCQAGFKQATWSELAGA